MQVVERSALDELLDDCLVHEILAAPRHFFFLNYFLRLWFFFCTLHIVLFWIDILDIIVALLTFLHKWHVSNFLISTFIYKDYQHVVIIQTKS